MKTLLLTISLFISIQSANAGLIQKFAILPKEVASWNVSLSATEEGFLKIKSDSSNDWWAEQMLMKRISVNFELITGKSESYTLYCYAPRTAQSPNPSEDLNKYCDERVSVIKEKISTVMNSSDCHPKYFFIRELSFEGYEYEMCNGETIRRVYDISIGQNIKGE